MTIEDRFRAKVDESGPVPPHRPELGPCHVWTGTRYSPNGYGQFWDGERYVGAHRHALRRALGRRLAPGEQALHHCDNPPCVRGTHLFAGTSSDNVADAARKGRRATGERHHKARLTETQVLAIRARHASGVTQVALAAEFGVQTPAVFKIVSRRTWAHLPS